MCECRARLNESCGNGASLNNRTCINIVVNMKGTFFSGVVVKDEGRFHGENTARECESRGSFNHPFVLLSAQIDLTEEFFMLSF